MNTVSIIRKDDIVEVEFGDGKGNILNRDTIKELVETARQLKREIVRSVILTGRGQNFSYGASVEEHLPPHYAPMLDDFRTMMYEWLTLPFPVYVIIKGYCLGGGFELSLVGDYIVGVEGAKSGVPEITLGVFPPFAVALLPNLLPYSRAFHLIASGEILDISTIKEMFLDIVATPEKAKELIHAHIKKHYGDKSMAVLKKTIELIKYQRMERCAPLKALMESACEVYCNELMKMKDPVEGLNSFLEKRKPQWSHS